MARQTSAVPEVKRTRRKNKKYKKKEIREISSITESKKATKTTKRDETEREPLLLLLGFYLVWAAVWLCGIRRVSAPVLLPDEFGYWSHAAFLTGRDWRDVTAQFSWYSFGYSLLLTPLFFCFRHPALLYRAAVSFNFVLLAAGSYLAYRLLCRLLPKENRRLLAFGAGATLLYPSFFTYANTAMTESLLAFLYLLLAWRLYRWFQRPTAAKGLAAGVTAGYLYLVHMRGAGILAAVLLCVFLASFFGEEKKRKALCALCILAAAVVFVVLSAAGKNFFIAQTGSQAYEELVQINDYGGQWRKIAFLFTADGMFRLLSGIFGKLFYMGCASFGLYYWGMGFLLREAKRLFTGLGRKEDVSASGWLFLWLLLSHAAAFAISVLFCLEADSLDGLLYGRYHEYTVFLICVLGIVELVRRPLWKRRVFWLLGLLCGGFFLTGACLKTGEIQYLTEQPVTGIHYAILLAGRYGWKTLLYAYGGGLLGSLALVAAAQGTKRKTRFQPLLFLIPLLWLPVSLTAASHLVWKTNERRQEDYQMLYTLGEAAGQAGAERIVFLKAEMNRGACIIQYLIPDIPVRVYTAAEAETEGTQGDFVIFLKGNSDGERWSGGQITYLTSPLFEVYYDGEQGAER